MKQGQSPSDSVMDLMMPNHPCGDHQLVVGKHSSPPLQPQRWLSPMKSTSKKAYSYRPQLFPDMEINVQNDSLKSMIVRDTKFRGNHVLKTSFNPPIQPQRRTSIQSEEISLAGSLTFVPRTIPFDDHQQNNNGSDRFFDLILFSKPSNNNNNDTQRQSEFTNDFEEYHVHAPQLLSTKYKSVASVSALTLETFDDDKELKRRSSRYLMLQSPSRLQRYKSGASISALTLDTFDEDTELTRRSSRYSMSQQSPSRLALIDENDAYTQPSSPQMVGSPPRNQVGHLFNRFDDSDNVGMGRLTGFDIVLPGLDQDSNQSKLRLNDNRSKLALDLDSICLSEASSVSSCTFDVYPDDLSKLNRTSTERKTSGISRSSVGRLDHAKNRENMELQSSIHIQDLSKLSRASLELQANGFSRSSWNVDMDAADDMSKLNRTSFEPHASDYSRFEASMKAPVPPRRQDTLKTLESLESSES